ncbi:MAG: preprotein translocase subunit SecG [Burkholderiaceae bacterium]
MQVLSTVLLALQMLSALVMIGLILVQHGKGADMGAAFGSGGSGSLFGASGSANFMSRATAVLAAVFFVSTLALAYFSGVRPMSSGSVLEKAAVVAPAGTASSAASGAAPIPTAATPAPATVPAAATGAAPAAVGTPATAASAAK